MKIKPIILVSGEPNSIFFEIFFKAVKSNNFKSPLILICCKKLILKEMKKYKFKKNLRILNINKLNLTEIDNKYLNVIDTNLRKSLKKKFKLNIPKNILKTLLI